MRILIAVLATVCALQAQSWDNLSKLKPGDRVKVLDTSGIERKGAFAGVSADAIMLRTEGGEEAIERAKVRRVQLRSVSHRVRNAMLGAAIGVATGVAIDNTLGRYLRNETGESDAARAMTYVAPIGLFGGLAAAFPGYRTVYRVR